MGKIVQKIIASLLLFTSLLGMAQVYPVQMTPVFHVPYSSRLSDYANSMDVRMRLLVNTTDIGINNRQVRLKMYVQGNGIQAQSSEVVVGMNPIYINGGELLTLTNLELAPLFRLENLEGMSPSQYANALPEGLYTICFELYDFLTNQKISQKSCAQLYLMLNDPPLLNTPSRNESIAVSDFPNILFTWTPRQINATNVSYQFELKEILDPTIDPQIGFLTSPILYEEELRSTALLYDVSKPNLLPGKRYAWRVRAMSTSGLSLNNVFKNDGYSEIYHFTYASHCPAPTFILSEAVSARSVRVSWLGDKSHTKYHVQYRKSNVAGAEWFEVYTMNTQTTLSDLEAGVSYEFRVGGSCEPAVLGNTATFTYSGINQFSMPATGTATTSFTCGLNPTIAIANQTPITNLIVSETFTAGDFPVKILELTGNNPYTGKGYIIVPYLADTKIAVAFNNITVNTNYQLIKGVVETTYNPEAPNISDVEDLSGWNNGQIVTQTVPFVITTITTNPNGDIIVGGANGEQITIPGGSNTVITGGNGQIYNVDSQGNATGPFVPAPGGATTAQNTDGVASNGQASQFTAQGVSVRFEPISNTKYAWDTAPTTAPSYIKEKYAKVGSDYLSYKAVVNGQRDVLKAKIVISDHKIVQDSIIFKTQHGVLIDKEKTSDGYLLTLKGTKTYAEEEVQAVIKQGGKYKIINAFRLTHISEKPINVTLIPLNSSNSIPSSAITQLQEVYTKAGVTLNIKTAPVLPYDGGGDNKITTSESGVFDYYTDEEKSINAKIKALPDYDPKTYYLIYSNLPSDKGIEGFMALGGQFGYIFTPPSGVGGLKTAAHELAHGVFALQHPFANATDKGKTPFLMDYGSGAELGHLDWAQINNPALKYYGFQGDSQGEQATVTNLEQLKKFRNNDGSITFLSVAGIPITLKGNITDISFVTSEDKWNISKNFFPLGTLIGFTIDGKNYSASKTVNTNQFQGYAYYDKADNANNSYYEENITSKSKPKNILIGITCFKNNEPIFKIFPTDYFDKHPKTILEKNRGAGEELSELSLSDYINNESQAVEIYAKFDKDFSEEQLFFLDKYSKKGNVCGADALNLFKAAYYINDSKGLLNCLQDAENDTQSSLTASLTVIREQNYNPNINHTRVITPRFEDGSYKADWEVKNKTQAFYAAFLRIIKNYYSINKIKSSEYDTLENQDISDIVNFFDLGKAKGRTCLLRNIPFELRKKIIEKYSTWTITTDKESLLIDLIETLPNEDVSKFLDYLKQSNYKMLWELEDEINGSNSERFAYVISSLILNTYQVPSELNSFPKTNETPNPNKSTRFLYLANNESFYYDGQSVTFNARADKSAGNLTLSCNTSYSQPYNGLSHYRMYYEGSPYDFVRVRFINDYRFSKLGSDESIKKEDEAIVPAYWYYWLLNRQNTVENIRNVRLVLDAAAVAASVLTAEPGPIVIVDGVVGAVDIGFQLNEEKLANGSEQDKAFYKEWDDLYTLYGSVVGAGILTKQLYNGGKYLFVNKNKIWENLKTSPSQLVKLGSGIKSVLKNIQFYKAANSGVKNRMYAYLLSAYLEIKIRNFVTEVNSDVSFVVKNGRLITKTNSYETEIAKVLEESNGNVQLNDLKFYTGKTEDVVSVEAKFAKVTENGSKAYELIKIKNGQLWLREVQGAGSLFSKLDNLGLTALKTEINLLDDVAKAKFLDEFAGASDDALRAMNGNTSLVNYWKANGNFIKNKTYPNVGHKVWDDTKNAIVTKADPTETKILNAIENAPPPTNNQVAVAGAYSPELGGNVVLKYNDKNFNVNLLEPELKQHLDYLTMIKNDFDKGGSLYQKLYSNVPLEKIQNAGLAGTHAEVLATNEVIKQLKQAGKFNSIQDLNKVHVLVKGRPSFGNMCRCPHCFQIIDGVKMIGNQ